MLDSSKVSMRECRISEFNMASSTCDAVEGGEVRLEMNTHFSIESREEGSCKAELDISIKPIDGPYYAIDATVAAVFDLSADANDEETESYLQAHGAERMLDFARVAIEGMTAFGMYGSVKIPTSLPVSVASS